MSSDSSELHQTLRKFGAPASVIREYEHWSVLLRPAQATLGSLVLVARGTQTEFSALPPAAFGELATVTADLEHALHQAFDHDRLNYLMLMMVDPQVHFHVLPRYARSREFAGVTFADPGWPGPPELGHTTDTDEATRQTLFDALDGAWPRKTSPSG
ncbi:diadenosine tetraphosphate (Ap4A) HIT family hydrolase [Kushneria sinocarnis]|uniref:Diadenosine tetraphosphate (Ap4A) HIT family hydrolase n=1 Tax=Kushneria sinocarnis TaxID=595502 RepID=A0A420X0G8_9GAMM|nr:HIT family protein [Kushneria sinocarnis]RKR06945.1 diadenosine tetraphosphate (Ap4A) HIT family hydrolase [Kushneria sinocarnis]